MSLTMLLLIIVVVVLLSGGWGYRSGNWSAPGGLAGLILLILLVLWLTGNVRLR
jgi:hypothetical protein